jgi:hypothetical protein
MKTEAFAEVLEKIHAREKNVLVKKAAEYAREDDRLSNFQKAAALQSCTPERACFGMMAKHLVSVADMVNDLEKGIDTPMPMWEEKLGDARNYLALLEGILRDRYPRSAR